MQGCCLKALSSYISVKSVFLNNNSTKLVSVSVSVDGQARTKGL